MSPGTATGAAHPVMADGSVRFISENVSDDVFKGLCTIKGGEPKGVINRDAPKIEPSDEAVEPLPEAPQAFALPLAPAPKVEVAANPSGGPVTFLSAGADFTLGSRCASSALPRRCSAAFWILANWIMRAAPCPSTRTLRARAQDEE